MMIDLSLDEMQKIVVALTADVYSHHEHRLWKAARELHLLASKVAAECGDNDYVRLHGHLAAECLEKLA